jgi:hypothetical protein
MMKHGNNAGVLLATAAVLQGSGICAIAEDAGGEEQEHSEQGQDGMDGDADDAQWNGEDPNNRRQNERDQCDGPAKDEEDAPPDKENERLHSPVHCIAEDWETSSGVLGRGVFECWSVESVNREP